MFKAVSSEWVLAERAVALGGMYHWTALVTLVVGWSVALVGLKSTFEWPYA